MTKKDSLIIYIGVFVVIVVIFLFCFIDRDDDDDEYYSSTSTKDSYKDVSVYSNFKNKIRKKSSMKNIQRHPVLDYQKRASKSTVPATIGDPIRPLNLGESLNSEHSDKENDNFHPVLEYQRNSSYGNFPATWGDPIRPSYLEPGPNNFEKSTNESNYYAYHPNEGPYVGMPIGVPVKMENMKLTSEYYKAPFYNNYNLNNSYPQRNNNNLPFSYQNKPLYSYDYFKPYGPNNNSMQSEINYADTPFYNKNSIYGNNLSSIPFISSVDSFTPFPEVNSNWEKSGMIQTVDPSNTEIMNIYRKPIAPLRDLFEYSVQDKNGFVVPLKETYLEDGDIIHSVPGREALGKWRYNDYVRYKYVWQ